MSNSNTTQSPLLLIFKHFPKAGGGSIFSILEEIKPKTFFTYDLEKLNLSDVKAVNESYIRIHEFQELTIEDKKKGFVISSMREPCSYLLSLWSFGSLKRGGLFLDMWKRDINWTKSAFGKDEPLFDSEEDISSFRDVWLKNETVNALIEKRFRDSYGSGAIDSDSPPEQVDCWIFVENFQESLVSCLQQYEKAGGFVMWDTPILSKLVQDLDERQHNRILYEKNNALGFGNTNPQNFHHAKCSRYFDNATAHAIETGTQSFIYKQFHYEGCCREERRVLESDPFLINEGTKRNDLQNITIALDDSSQDEKNVIPGNQTKVVVEEDIYTKMMENIAYDGKWMTMYNKIQYHIVGLLIMTFIVIFVKKTTRVRRRHALRKKTSKQQPRFL